MAEELAGMLQALGYEVTAQTFQFSTAVNTLVILEVFASVTLIASGLWALNTAPALALLPALLLLASASSFRTLHHRAEVGAVMDGARAAGWARLGARHTARNLSATLPHLANNAAAPHLYLIAHYDSKSQRLPIIVRIILFTALLTGGLGFAFLTPLALIIPALSGWATLVGGLAAVAGLPLMGMDWGNASPGAIDNASGVGLVLHLAEVLAQRPDLGARLRWTILLTSAEELGLMGAAAYVKQHARELREQSTAGGLYVLNFDGIGVDGKMFVEAREQTRAGPLLSLIMRAAREAGVPIGRFGLPGVLFDHMPFARRGLDAATLLAIGPATWAVHTPRDTVERLHPRGFAQAGEVALKVIELLSA